MSYGRIFLMFISCFVSFVALSACKKGAGNEGGTVDKNELVAPPAELIQQLESHAQLSCFTNAFKTFKLSRETWDKGITIFAPENQGSVCAPLSTQELKNHIVSEMLNKEQLSQRTSLASVGGKPIPVRRWPGEAQGVRLNGIALNETSATGGKFRLYVAERPLFSLPGEVVVYSAPSSQRYIGNPSICILSNGDYLASHDFFGAGITSGVSRIYRSINKGLSWTQIAELHGQQVSNLFVHSGKLYILGLDKTGQVVIRRSEDNGLSWTIPSNDQTGLLRTGLYQTASSAIVIHNGRIWKAVEQVTGAASLWAKAFEAMVISAPIGSDLLKASSWTSSTSVPYNSTWLSGRFEGMLEGGALLGTDGVVRNVLRVHTNITGQEYAALIKISADGATSNFNPSTDFSLFPGGTKKFSIRYDQQSGKYWSLVNSIAPDQWAFTWTSKIRNTLALISSTDLKDWTVNKIIVNHPDVEKHGFQYVDWDFDGKDIIMLIRSSFDDGKGTPNDYHDANYLFFKRINAFSQYKDKNYPYGPLP
jgi:hypothetical protein